MHAALAVGFVNVDEGLDPGDVLVSAVLPHPLLHRCGLQEPGVAINHENAAEDIDEGETDEEEPDVAMQAPDPVVDVVCHNCVTFEAMIRW